MNLSAKICLAVSLFIVSASVAWAGFNYDSAHNYFMIDSILKSGGSYVLVGDAFNEIPNAFAVSNNLIFLNPAGQFLSGDRQMDKNSFATSQIKVQSSNNPFEISAITGVLTIGSDTFGNTIDIKMDNSFVLQSSGLAMIDLVTPAANTIYAGTVLTHSLQSYNNTALSTSPESKLTISAGGTATIIPGGEDAIKLGNAPFCKKISWVPADEANHQLDAKQNATLGATSGDQSNAFDCSALGSITGRYAHKICCPTNYLIYDVDKDAGKMVCCRAR